MFIGSVGMWAKVLCMDMVEENKGARRRRRSAEQSPDIPTGGTGSDVSASQDAGAYSLRAHMKV